MNMTVKIALLLPGQGSQFVGMGKALVEQYPVAAEVFGKANDVLGIDLAKICFEGPQGELVLTQNQQPALLTTSIACWEVLKAEGLPIQVVGCAGLSLGEYTALVVAGALSFADALKLVRARGTFMQEACELRPGGMASVMGLKPDQVREVCEAISSNGSSRVLNIANINCPGQIVVSGDKEAIAEAEKRFGAFESARSIVLNVSGAFHSRLMQSAQEKLAAMIDSFTFAQPTVPVISNVTGQEIREASEIKDLLIQQVTSSVLWEHCVRTLLASRPDLFLELGSGKVLCGLLRKTEKSAKYCPMGDPEGLVKVKELVGSQVELT
jgi:[acyl-carrier-protein] S-malonyltransferase